MERQAVKDYSPFHHITRQSYSRYNHKDRAMFQAVSSRPLTAEAPARSQIISCGLVVQTVSLRQVVLRFSLPVLFCQ